LGSYFEQEKAIKAIGEIGGYGAEYALSEINNENELMYNVRERALETLVMIKRESGSKY